MEAGVRQEVGVVMNDWNRVVSFRYQLGNGFEGIQFKSSEACKV